MQGKTLSTRIALTSFVDNTSRVARPRFESFLEQRSLPPPNGRTNTYRESIRDRRARGRYINGPQALFVGNWGNFIFGTRGNHPYFREHSGGEYIFGDIFLSGEHNPSWAKFGGKIFEALFEILDAVRF